MLSLALFLSLSLIYMIISFPLQASSNPLFRRKTTCENGKQVSDQRCCIWYDVLEQVQEELFAGGECDEVAHDALRLSFHDAVGFSKSLKAAGKFPGGGADGSIMIFRGIETVYPGNAGLDEIIEAERLVAWNYNVTWGDFIQFAGAVSVGNCVGGPKVPFWAGRPNATMWAPSHGLLPDAGDTVTNILARMDDAGFTPSDLVTLLASHSIGMQEEQDHSIPFTPFDTTPESLDSQFYLEVLLNGTAYPGNGPHGASEVLSPLPGEFRLQSDFAIARDNRTACFWEEFVFNEGKMQSKFATAMDKMSIVGHDRNDLYDCSDVIPTPSRPKNPALPTLPVGLDFKDVQFACTPTPTHTKKFKEVDGPLQTVPPFDKGHDRLQDLASAAADSP
ncbi:heme peroxidase [Flagelloscypha sp. PMI_526]|nr:heme peroxidase [Flagelloscypha sp. PMI_526]